MEDYKKKYEDAFERAKDCHIDGLTLHQPVKAVIEHIFPEFKESEDEKIRKELITWLQSIEGQSLPIDRHNAAIAWLEKQGKTKFIDGTFVNVDDVREEFIGEVYRILDSNPNNDRANQIINAFDQLPTIEIEKQGEQKQKQYDIDILEKHITKDSISELAHTVIVRNGWEIVDAKEQKPADKVEPKFKVGDWIVNTITNETEQVIELTGCEYICSGHLIVSFNSQHLLKRWTIQDAKDGDVLAVDGGRGICIFDGTVEEGIYPFAYCGLTRYGFESYDRKLPFTHYNNVYPATKEQRDALFQKMKEAGYEWLDKDRKLIKIAQ